MTARRRPDIVAPRLVWMNARLRVAFCKSSPGNHAGGRG